MGESIQYIGSKISLISKSEIRYEGTLYTIDAQDSIIVLAKVLSFGTEDRPCEMPVPAKQEVFEFIIFRGTDIKQIEVCEAPKPLSSIHNDPAIVGVQVQQHTAPSVATSYPGASFSHQPLGPIGSVGSYYGNYGQQLGQQNLPSSGFSIGVSQPSELSSGIGSSVGGVNVEPQSPGGNSSQPVPGPIGVPPRSTAPPSQPQQDVLSGSRSSTPSVSRKSPVADAGVQVSPPPQQQIEKKRTNMINNQRPLQTQERQMRENNHHQQQQHHHQQQQQQQHHHQQQQNQVRRGPPQQAQNQYYQQGVRHNQGYQGYYNQQQYQGQYRGGMGRGRGARRPTQTRGGRGTFNQVSGGKRQIFDKEYDFEQANVQFEEMMTQMAKTKISENGEKKDDSGHETATTGDESEDSTSSVYYDKTKSFFDSISCEALERSKGKSQRSDWRQERKMNVETFGVATARRGYYSRGRGGYYVRGGYYRNNYNQGYYRGNSNYRGSRGGGGNHPNPQRTSNINGAIGGPSVNSGNSSSYASAVRSSGPAK